MDLVHIWYNVKYRSKVSISNILLWPIVQKGQKLGHKVKSEKKTMCTLQRHSFNAIFMKLHETECSSQFNLGQDQDWVMSGQKLGHKLNT